MNVGNACAAAVKRIAAVVRATPATVARIEVRNEILMSNIPKGWTTTELKS